MSWLTVNGIELATIIAANGAEGTRRDIGASDAAGDGTWRTTRRARKYDQKLTTIPLAKAEAHAWECLLTGQGERWSFDGAPTAGAFGSKGLAYSNATLASIVTGTPKFGTHVLRLGATTGTVRFENAARSLAGVTTLWTVMVWRFEGADWAHYVVTSSGHKWGNGIRNDALGTSWLSVTSGNVFLNNTAGAAQDYDDLVILPFEILDDWGATFGTATAAFSALPNLTCAGDLVPEASTRTMVCDGDVSDEVVKTAAGGKHVLDFTLRAV